MGAQGAWHPSPFLVNFVGFRSLYQLYTHALNLKKKVHFIFPTKKGSMNACMERVAFSVPPTRLRATVLSSSCSSPLSLGHPCYLSISMALSIVVDDVVLLETQAHFFV